MAAGMKTMQGGSLVPWATTIVGGDYPFTNGWPSQQGIRRALIGMTYKVPLWRPNGGTVLLYAWLDHWRKVGSFYRPVWGLHLNQQTGNAVVDGQAAFRCHSVPAWVPYGNPLGAGGSFNIGREVIGGSFGPTEATHNYWLEPTTMPNVTVPLQRYTVSSSTLGPGGDAASIGEFRYNSNWAAKFPGNDASYYVTGYVSDATVANINDLRGNVTTGGNYSVKSTTTEADFFVG